MKRQYTFTAKEAKKFSKYGIDLTVYGGNIPEASVVHEFVRGGHFEEFYNLKSYFIYYVIKGKGTFVLDDEKVEAKETDLIVIPPKTRIHFFGKMELLLTVAPSYNEKNERHVRMVDKKESPYCKGK